jgi:hypothetical protein
MKFATFFIPALALAQKNDDDRKVPPRHPLQRLARLVEFSHKNLDDWFTFLPSKDAWKSKFTVNAVRMERNFLRGEQRCGFYNQAQLPHGGPERKRREVDDYDYQYDYSDDGLRYDMMDPAKGSKQITTGFRKWAERYLSACFGQRTYDHQVKRMNKWNQKLQAHLLNQAP